MKTKFLHIIFFFIIALLILCSCNIRDKKEDKNVTYEIAFLNEILNDSSIIGSGLYKHKIIADVEILTPPNIEDFSKESEFVMNKIHESDSTFILNQFSERKLFTTNELSKFGFKIIPYPNSNNSEKNIDYFTSIFKKNDGLLIVSKPIFNKSKTFAYFRYGYTCGALCGYGKDLILEKKNNKWVINEITSFWMS